MSTDAQQGRPMKATVLDTLKRSAAVPSVPQVVLRFLEIMQDPEFTYRDLVKVLSADAGTVSEVLRLSNSALFGVRSKVVSLQHALTLLGPKRVRSILLGRYLVDAMSKKNVTGLDMSYFWRRSLASSVVASHFSALVLPKRRDEVSIGALLADIGIPILAEAFPKAYGPIVATYCPHGRFPSTDEERAIIQVSHGEVAAMVLSHWSIPEDITRAVNLHESENPGADDVAMSARLLHSGDRVAKLLCEVPNAEEVAQTCNEATAFVGVDVGALLDLLPTIEKDIEELADALRIDVIPSNVYGLIAKTIEDVIAAPATAE